MALPDMVEDGSWTVPAARESRPGGRGYRLSSLALEAGQGTCRRFGWRGREREWAVLASVRGNVSEREGGTRWRKMNGFGSFSRGEGIDYIQGRGLLTDYY